jgi:hypothetical protein
MRTNMAVLAAVLCLPAALPAQWTTIGHDAQHTGQSAKAAQNFNRIKWQTPVDQILVGTPGDLLIHYGTPVITAANTVLLPVRTLADTMQVEARSGVDGSLKYTLVPPTPYTFPPHTWIPSYSGALTVRNRYYYPCSGGTVCYRDTPDSNTGATGQIAFYGTALYNSNPAAFDSTVMISTPISADRYGNIYFGYIVTGANPANLTSSGLARIPATGTASSFVTAATASGDPAMFQVQVNSAPALSIDHQTLYFPVSAGPGLAGYLVSVSAATLTPLAKVRLTDPNTGLDARVLDISTASPTIGLDGDVYFGAFESTCCLNHARGWMLHYNGALTVTKTPGAFGWDADASTIPRALVPSYAGTSQYLILTKYNNYDGVGGDGNNKVAVLDPNATMTDPVTGVSVMKEVITVSGPTPDGPPPAVREWCINSAAIDLVTKSAMINSEDGKLYRWDFTTNTLSQTITLTAGVGEAYTPTIIGPDGTVYAINDAMLFAVGQ